MKRFLTLLAFIAMTMLCEAQVTVTMEKDGGIYKIPCKVNGVKMKFIFDTGASMVSMSQSMAQFLFDGEYLSPNDIKGTGQSLVADGSIVNHTIVILRDIEIGGLHLNNIEATIIEGMNAPLLLGQSAIQEIGKITIDGDKLIISSNSSISEERINQLFEDAIEYLDAKSYLAAAECLEQLYDLELLSPDGIIELAFAYSQSEQDEKCLRVCKEWLAENELQADNFSKSRIYSFIASSYNFGYHDYNEAILWYQKELNYTDKSDYSSIAYIEYFIANCYYNTERYKMAQTHYSYAFSNKCYDLGIDGHNVEKKTKDSFLAEIMYYIGDCEINVGDVYLAAEILKSSARMGNNMAKNKLRAAGFTW